MSATSAKRTSSWLVRHNAISARCLTTNEPLPHLSSIKHIPSQDHQRTVVMCRRDETRTLRRPSSTRHGEALSAPSARGTPQAPCHRLRRTKAPRRRAVTLGCCIAPRHRGDLARVALSRAFIVCSAAGGLMGANGLNRQYGTADAPDEARLKYRGIEYSLHQIRGGVWKWSASVGGVSIMGVAKGESEAVARAETAIDQALGAVYDDDSFVRCKLCGGWINTHSPSSLLEHRGPLPHPRIAGAEWIDDDD
jgi:hypothetical protein